jgi:hypothetical protein
VHYCIVTLYLHVLWNLHCVKLWTLQQCDDLSLCVVVTCPMCLTVLVYWLPVSWPGTLFPVLYVCFYHYWPIILQVDRMSVDLHHVLACTCIPIDLQMTSLLKKLASVPTWVLTRRKASRFVQSRVLNWPQATTRTRQQIFTSPKVVWQNQAGILRFFSFRITYVIRIWGDYVYRDICLYLFSSPVTLTLWL